MLWTYLGYRLDGLDLLVYNHFMSFDKDFEHNQSLFDAALKEFTEVGYDHASINTILKNADMSKGQFYYHFESKQDLYLRLIEVLIERKRTFLGKVMQPEDFEQDIFSIFKTQIRHGLAFAAAEPQIEAFSQAFLHEQGHDIYDVALQRFNFKDDVALNELVTRAHDQGQFQEQFPLTFVQRLVGYLFSHVSELTDLTSREDMADNLDIFIDFMKHGLVRRDED